MTEPIESSVARDVLPSRLGQAVAVVVIVAGVVFVAAVVFFTGAVLGASRGGYGDPDGWPGAGQHGPGGRPGTCPMMDGGPMTGGGMMGPDWMPGRMMGPGSSPMPPTPTPAAPRP
ncbi:hypothetical protein [Mycobacterium parmense]|nr:hypothetical protein [Mycobacterium parmense]MCV7353451.1 hypothetical protein [Mycobacterium parmense]ORW51530.1 hypothetical protein AWC20_22470 [Mycobacterium parmense]